MLGPVPEGLAAATRELDAPALLHWLARGRRRYPGGFAGLCAMLGVAQPPAAGPLAHVGRGLAPTDSVIYRARPLHLRADRDRVLVFAGGDIEPDDAEANTLVRAFNDSFGGDGIRLEYAAGDWFVTMPEPLPADPEPLDRLAGRYLDEALPGGAERAGWRRFLNETQMLFHELELNLTRSEQGRPEINGLWLWGGGRLGDRAQVAVDRVCSDDALCRGLARLGGIEPEAGVRRLSQLGGKGDSVLADWPDSAWALLAGDAEGWLRSLAGFEEAWAAEGCAAVANGSWRELTLHGGAEIRALGRFDRLRLWKRRGRLADRVTERGPA